MSAESKARFYDFNIRPLPLRSGSPPQAHTESHELKLRPSREKSFALLGSFARKFFICVYSPASPAQFTRRGGRKLSSSPATAGRSESSSRVEKGWRFKFAEVRHRFRLTPTEKRVAVFVVAAFVLGLATKCYRDAHASPTPAARQMEQANSIRTTKAKRVSPKPTTELSDR